MFTPGGAAMPYLSSHIRRLQEIKAAREKALLDNAEGLWARVEAERRAVDRCAMQLRAALLAREHAQV
jgi:hypothetical protein